MDPKKFLLEFVERLIKENPKFFKPLSWLFFVLLCFSGAVALLNQYHVQLPEWVAFVNAKILASLSAMGWIMSRLPNKDPNEIK